VNSTPTRNGQVQPARLPFDDDSDPAPPSERFAGILAGNEKAIAEAACHMIQVGGGLGLSGTSDGGAVSVTVFYGRMSRKKYAASPETLAALLEAVCAWRPAQPLEMRPTRLSERDRRH